MGKPPEMVFGHNFYQMRDGNLGTGEKKNQNNVPNNLVAKVNLP